MASLALGWVGEPAFAGLVEPLLSAMGVESRAVLHTVGFIISFTVITALHLVAGEQVPKILAIRTAETLVLPLSPLLKGFYVMTYPLLVALSATTSFVLARMGVVSAGEHDETHTEDELRALMLQARVHGEVSSTEHRLIHAVFEFDDMVCRRIMLPRSDIVWIDVTATFEQCLDVVRRTKHTRYPVCDGSLDKIIGVVHLKDMLVQQGDAFDLRAMIRPPRQVPESMSVSKLLRLFQASQQHLAFVIDEHGTVTGLVTFENVIEEIIGPVEDEFDTGNPAVVPTGEGEFLVRGAALVDEVSRKVGLRFADDKIDTMSGLLTHILQRVPEVGDIVELPGMRAHVMEVVGARATGIRLVVDPDAGG
tara:strand:- start:267 stop:1361 length:1095 start_codon:yes stop_codon:yes gene_type:complete